MSTAKDSEELLNELLSIDDIEKRKEIIFNDISKRNPKYKIIAQDDPYKLFDALGGDEDEVIRTHNWAYEYTFNDFLTEQIDNGYEFDEDTFEGTKEEWKEYQNHLNLLREKFDEKEESIKRANDTGNYYVTGLYEIKGKNNIILPFEWDFCEGYLESIIGTPYDTPKDHGYSFD